MRWSCALWLNETPHPLGGPAVFLRPLLEPDQDPYRPGDHLVWAWSGELDLDATEAPAAALAAAVTLAGEDRPSGGTCRSVLAGDVVVVGEAPFIIAATGMAALEGPVEVESHRSWAEAARAIHAGDILPSDPVP